MQLNTLQAYHIVLNFMCAMVDCSFGEIKMNSCFLQQKRRLLASEFATNKVITLRNNQNEMMISHISKISNSDMWNHTDTLQLPQTLNFLRRSKICEITQTEQYTIVRTNSGLAGVFNTITNTFICFLNNIIGEVIRSIYYNTIRQEIIKVSVSQIDDYSALHCYSYQVNDLNNCTNLFVNDDIVYPGFIEFDSINNRTIIFEGRKGKYRIYELSNYICLYEFGSGGIWDLKMTPGALLIIKNLGINEIGLTFIGNNQESMNSVIKVNNSFYVEFVDRFELSIIFKEKDNNVCVVDLSNGAYSYIPNSSSLNVSDFIFLYKAKKMIIYWNGEFKVFSFLGEYLFSISVEGKLLDNFPVGIAKDQNFLIVCTQLQFDQWIFMFSVEDGTKVYERYFPPQVNNGYKITSLSFDNTYNILAIGNEAGDVSFYG